jgi:hypothetical protein
MVVVDLATQYPNVNLGLFIQENLGSVVIVHVT